jgi:hypothetical protein
VQFECSWHVCSSIAVPLQSACNWNAVRLSTKALDHRLSIPAYAIKQQRWQSAVPKNKMSLMSLILKDDAFLIAKLVTMWHYLKNYWHATKCSSISFAHWQCPSDGDVSFPRFVGLLILSLCSRQTDRISTANRTANQPCSSFAVLL